MIFHHDITIKELFINVRNSIELAISNALKNPISNLRVIALISRHEFLSAFFEKKSKNSPN